MGRALRREAALQVIHCSVGFPWTGEFSHKLQRLSSNGTASSSEELEEKDGTTTPFEQSR